MRLIYRMSVMILLLVSLMPLQAQDTTPPPTVVVPLNPSGQTGSTQPQLEEIVPVETPIPEVTADPGAEVTPDPAAPVTDLAPASAAGCPSLVAEGFNAATLECINLTSGETCLGYGAASATARTAVDGFSFSQPGDRAQFSRLDTLRLQTFGTANQTWSVMLASPSFNTDDIEPVPVTATMLAFGEVSLIDTGDAPAGDFPAATVIATSGMNVRRQPNTGAVVVWQLGAGEEVIATGRTNDEDWIRIVIPNEFAGTGWVYAPYLEVAGGETLLPLVNPGEAAPVLTPPEFGPMQSFRLATTPVDASCEGVPDSGVIIQSPNAIASNIRFRVNGVSLALNGTLFLEAQPGGTLDISVLEGLVTADTGDVPRVAQAGSLISIAMSDTLAPNGAPTVQIYDLPTLLELPLNRLPRQFALGTGGTQTAQPGAAQPTPVPAPGQPTPDGPVIVGAAGVLNLNATPTVGLLDVVTGDAAQPTAAAPETNNTGGGVNIVGVNTFATPTAGTGVNITGPAATTPEISLTSTGSEVVITGNNPVVSGFSLTSDQINGNICELGEATSLSVQADNTDSPAVTAGGTWQAAGGITVVFSVTNRNLTEPDPDYGDYIRLVDDSGNIVAQSGDETFLVHTFGATTTFTAEFAAEPGDFLLIRAECTLS